MSNRSLTSRTRDERDAEGPKKFSIVPYREQGSLWTWTAYDDTPEFKPTTDTIRGLSCYQYAPPIIDRDVSKVVELTEEDLEAWLKAPAPLKQGEPHCGGYKILQMNNPWSSLIIPLKSETFEAINKAFSIPPVALHVPTAIQGACGMFLQDDGSYVFIRRSIILYNKFSFVLRYDPTTNFTTGFIDADIHCDFSLMFSTICHQFLACPHPLLIPVLMTEIDFESSMKSIRLANAKLEEIERETGFTAMPDGSDSPKTRDYQLLVRKLGARHEYYSRSQTVVLSAKLVTQSYMKQLQRVDRSLPKELQEKLAPYSAIFSDRLEYLLSSIEHALLHSNIPTRLQSQQAVLFNLIAQADNDINIGLSKDTKELAVASKRDSSAMKIIAFLTTLFLPGTFVASFVAMPLFNWQATSVSEATTSHFWVYWAITGPLTLATMTIVLSWAFLHGKKTRDLIRLARKGPDRKVGDEESGSTSEKSE